MQKYKNKIIAVVGILVVLGIAFWWGGNAPNSHGTLPLGLPGDAVMAPNDGQLQNGDKADGTVTDNTKADGTVTDNAKADGAVTDNTKANGAVKPAAVTAPPKTAGSKDTPSSSVGSKDDRTYSAKQGMAINSETGKDQYATNPVPVGKPVPIEPQNAVITDKELTCTLTVRCDTILNNLTLLNPDKTELVPDDGILLAETTVTFYEGESVFNILLRAMKANKIHFEFVNTPLYNSAYIEGIGNLYEFDCGDLSGWVYKVNGWCPNYGCSRYGVQQGDEIELLYTCDLGKDTGGYNALAGE